MSRFNSGRSVRQEEESFMESGHLVRGKESYRPSLLVICAAVYSDVGCFGVFIFSTRDFQKVASYV